MTTSAGLLSATSAHDVRIDEPVRVAVEIGVGDDVADLVRRFVVEQEAAQHRLLGFQRMGRKLEAVELGIVGHGVRRFVERRFYAGYRMNDGYDKWRRGRRRPLHAVMQTAERSAQSVAASACTTTVMFAVTSR